MSDSNLNSLARTLAERLITETDNFGDCSLEIAMEKAEAVIREAIEKTLDEAERGVTKVVVDNLVSDISEQDYAYLRAVLKQAVAAIRSLKPAQSYEPMSKRKQTK